MESVWTTECVRISKAARLHLRGRLGPEIGNLEEGDDVQFERHPLVVCATSEVGHPVLLQAEAVVLK
eukprot:6185458-Pleurochrysis_carterae.AAC.2